MAFTSDIFASRAAYLGAKLKSKGLQEYTIEEFCKWHGGPELNCLALEYLMGCNVLNLARIYELWGKEGCYKSAFAHWLAGMYFTSKGAPCLYMETENKYEGSLALEVLNGMNAEQFFRLLPVDTVEKMESHLKDNIKWIKDITAKDVVTMLLMIVDSIGLPSEETNAKFEENGFHERERPVEALLLTKLFHALPGMMRDLPLLLIYINHEKKENIKMGGRDVIAAKRSGADGMKFGQTVSIHLSKREGKANKTENYNWVNLKLYKNSVNESGRDVDMMVIHRQKDVEGTNMHFNIDESDAFFLATNKDLPREALLNAGVCDVKTATDAGCYSDSITGIKNKPAGVIMAAIRSDAVKMKKMREVLGITIHKTVPELLADGWFKDKIAKPEAKAEVKPKAAVKSVPPPVAPKKEGV